MVGRELGQLVPERTFWGQSYNLLMWSLIKDPDRPLRPLNANERILGKFILPDFQRQPVWTQAQQASLITNIYKGRPIPALVWNSTLNENECDHWLLDGQQRLTAILAYVEGKFPLNGWLYLDLPDTEKAHFLRISFPIIECSITSREECLDVYDSLVYGGTPHEPRP